MQLSFALAGVRTPLRAQQASAGRPATQDEPHCHEALALTRRLVLQREVELDVRPMPRSSAESLIVTGFNSLAFPEGGACSWEGSLKHAKSWERAGSLETHGRDVRRA